MPDFTFTRLQYDSGDWDVDQRMPSNLLNSLIEYTTLEVETEERVVPLGDPAMLSAPFCYLAGRRLVQLGPEERRNFESYVTRGGFVFVDDCNHDIDGLFAKSFESEAAKIFGSGELRKIQHDHPLYDSFFAFDKGPPTTSFELNGWGDDLETPDVNEGANDDYGDLRLQPGSLCINAGDPAFEPEPGETDLAGYPRVFCGRVDMGAYEFGIGDFDRAEVSARSVLALDADRHERELHARMAPWLGADVRASSWNEQVREALDEIERQRAVLDVVRGMRLRARAVAP